MRKKGRPGKMAGGRKTGKLKNGENLVFSRDGVTSVTPFPFGRTKENPPALPGGKK